MQVQIALTGDVTVGDVPVGGPSRVVLAALVLARPAGVPRERLADVLWPDGPPRTWASALRTHVSRVRSALAAAIPGAGETVVSGATGWQLALPPDVELAVDVERAEASLAAAREALGSRDTTGALAAASAAVDGLRAPFLPGHPGDWADEVRAGLDETVVAAHEVVSLAALAAGDPDRALAAADAAVARAPLRESAHRARWAALAAGGNRAEALRAYQRLRRGLADELGVDPSPETEAAYLDLLGTPGRPAPPAATATLGGPRPAAPFVGRERELSVLAEAWGQAAAGARHVVVLTGEAGIGKTRLTTEAARRIGHGGLVLLGRCDQEAIVPYQPVVEALDGLVAATPPDELPALSDEATAELAAVLPSLPGPRRAPGGDGRARLFGAMTDLVTAAAKERPLLLVLDDLQWADDDTLLLMRHLLRRAGDAAMLVVAITRDHDLEPGHTLGEVVHSLERDGWVRRLPLTGLAEEDVRELAARLGRDTDAGRLVEETAGNPYLVTELLRAGAGPSGAIPPGVHALVTSRIGRLDPATADLLRAAAVAGTRFELDLVAAAAGLEGRALLDAVDAALASGLVVEEDADRYRFPHDIVRRTLVAQLSAARRRALHHDMAEAIESRRAGELDDHAPVLAHHAAAGAGPRGDTRAVHWSRVASAQAAARSAPAEAVRLCRQALALVPPGDDALRAAVTAELGEAMVAGGDPAGPATLVEAADLAAGSDQPDVLTAVALALADAADDRPDLRPDALRIVRAAAATPDEDLVRRARLLARAIRLGDVTVPPAVAVEALHDHVAAVPPDAVDARRRLAADLAVLADASDEPRLLALAAHDRAMAAATVGDEPAVEAALAELRRWAPGGDPFARAMLADRAAARAVATGPPAAAAALLADVVTAHDTLAPGTGDAAASRHRAVLAHLSPVVGAAGPEPSGDGLHDLALAALAAAASGDAAAAGRARAALAPYADLACGDGYRTFAGAAAFHLGRLAAVTGEWAEAERHLLTALRLHTAWHARPWMAWTQVALAGVLEARGRPTDREWIAGLLAEADYVATAQALSFR